MAGGSEQFFEQVFHAVPSPMFVVDEDVRVQQYNRAAEALVGSRGDHPEFVRAGDLLHCIHAEESPGGCGRSDSCRICVVRGAVLKAAVGGTVYRREAKVTLLSQGRPVEAEFQVTTCPFTALDKRYVLLTLEEFGEVQKLESLLPICSWCRRARTSENYWQSVERYVADRLKLGLTHCICEECLEKNFAEDC
jgi:PAS domain-containing protein